MKKIDLNFLNNQKIIISISLFLIVLGIFLLPFNTWHFDIDDCGVIWNSRIHSLQDFLYLFVKGKDGVGLCFPSNYHIALSDCRPFLNSIHSFYRPLTLVFFGIQHIFFGAHAYPYFFIMILFHAINTALLYNMIYILYPWHLWASWAALFFGFHMSYWGWMGWIAAQPYTISLCLLMLATIYFIKYLNTNRLSYNITACILYGIAVFLFEFTFIFPVFICSLWLIKKDVWILKQAQNNKIKTIGLWLTALFFLMVRRAICPSNINLSENTFSQIKNFCAWLLTRKADFISFLVDLGNISCIPAGNQLLKGCIIILLIWLMIYRFIKNNHKKIILFCLLNIALFLWPAVLKQYTLRYLYYALPFFSCMILLLIDPAKKHRAIKILFWLLIIGNSSFVIARMINREQDLQLKTTALQVLVTTLRETAPQFLRANGIHNKALCFIAIPRGPFASGLAQNLWMLGINEDLPIFYDPSTFVENYKNISNNDIKITSIPHGLRLTSTNKNNIWWTGFGGENMRLGTKNILDGNDYVYDIEYTFDQKLLDLKPLFIMWDFEKNQFKILYF